MFLHGRASIVLALKTVFLLSIICFNYICFAQFGGGNGTEANPWQISRPEHLNQVRNHLDAFFIQTMNISLDMAPWNDGQGWDPIGNAAGTFTGFYDGDGHIIDGLFINRPQTQYIGLFGHTSLGAVIQNLGVTNVNITGQFSVGGLLGRNLSASKVINCFSTGTVTGTGERIGGLVGYNQNRNSNVINSYSRANVNGGTQVGGLVGHNRNAAAITGSYSTGRVAGDQTGGLVGFTQGWGDDPPDNNYWDSETSGQEDSAVGTGRLSRQMVFPYDQETYIGWDFENIWNDDDRNLMNDGYPVLYYQEPTDIELDTPEVEVELVTVNDTLHVQITWEAIDDANSYIVYASENPFSEDWGNPVAVITETRYNEPVNTEVRKFFHVVASIREP